MNSKPPRILFVDDHQDTLDLFEMVLVQQNYEVVTSSSIEGAIQETEAARFDLLILDSRVGDSSGVDLCRSIRMRDQDTPILFCSGLAYERNKTEALNAGAQAYMVKPVSITDLCATVRNLISTAPQQGCSGA